MKKFLMISLLLITVACGFGMTPLGDYEPPTQTEVLIDNTVNAVIVDSAETTFESITAMPVMIMLKSSSVSLELKHEESPDKYLVYKVPLSGVENHKILISLYERDANIKFQLEKIKSSTNTNLNKHTPYKYGLIYRC